MCNVNDSLFPFLNIYKCVGTHLVARCTSRFKLFRIMPLAEKHVIVHAISEIDQELFTVRASEACRMIEETQFTGWHSEAAVFQGRFAHTALLKDKNLDIGNFDSIDADQFATRNLNINLLCQSFITSLFYGKISFCALDERFLYWKFYIT